MSNNKFLQFITIIEMLLLLVVGVLSNKISELFEINKVFLIVTTAIVVIGLIAITIYKTLPSKKQKKTKQERPNASRITKSTVDKILNGILLLPSAIVLSYGAMKFSQLVEQNLFIEKIVGAITFATIFFTPNLIDLARKQKQSTTPVYIGLLFSVIYGIAGLFLRYSPDAIKTYVIFFAILHSIILTGQQVIYGYYTVVYSFGKWYNKLPEK